MSPEEIQDTTRRLNKLLIEKNLRWIVEEVSSVIEGGIEEKKSVSFQQFSVYGEFAPPRGPKSEVTATRPYTDDEQLELLIQAIKNVLVDGAAIRRAIFLNLEQTASVQEIHFEPDVPADLQEKGFMRITETQGHPFYLTQVDALDVEKLQRLSELTESVRKELNGNK